MSRLTALGMMSGTSMDGVDVAFIETDGESAIGFGPVGYFAYSPADRAILREAAHLAAQPNSPRRQRALFDAAGLVTARHAAAAEAFIDAHRVEAGRLSLIGFHGQTVLHRPREKTTLQLGDGPALAARLGVPVAYDFRSADVAAGGEGAPFVPAFHAALVANAGLERPVAILNVGGVANVTIAPREGDPIACDTGPGNALLDDLFAERAGAPFDRDGATAARGKPDAGRLAQLLDHPYFALPPPKSLDRNAFSRAPVADLALADAAATLVAFTAESAARCIRAIEPEARRILVCGGGAKNMALMNALQIRFDAPVQTVDDVGWSADAMEAQAFAYLAVRCLKGLPLTFPTTTGAPFPMQGGVIAEPKGAANPITPEP